MKDSHDRYANIEISYLLQMMEQYEGLSILATNLRGNLDDAFLRRLAFVVHFPVPDADGRRAIWERTWPADTPIKKGAVSEVLRVDIPDRRQYQEHGCHGRLPCSGKQRERRYRSSDRIASNGVLEAGQATGRRGTCTHCRDPRRRDVMTTSKRQLSRGRSQNTKEVIGAHNAVINAERSVEGDPRVVAMHSLQNDCGNSSLTGLFQRPNFRSLDTVYREAVSETGTPLDAGMRSRMQEKFLSDFDDVRIHHGEKASNLLASLGAKAATAGRNIFLSDSSQMNDATLLSHELAHVVQQASSGTSIGSVDVNHNPHLEYEADQAASTTQHVEIAGVATPSIQCQILENPPVLPQVSVDETAPDTHAVSIAGRPVVFLVGDARYEAEVHVSVDASEEFNIETNSVIPEVVINVRTRPGHEVEQDNGQITRLRNLGINVYVNIQEVRERRSSRRRIEAQSQPHQTPEQERTPSRREALQAELASIDAEAQSSGLTPAEIEEINDRRNGALEEFQNLESSPPATPPESRAEDPPILASFNPSQFSGEERRSRIRRLRTAHGYPSETSPELEGIREQIDVFNSAESYNVGPEQYQRNFLNSQEVQSGSTIALIAERARLLHLLLEDPAAAEQAMAGRSASGELDMIRDQLIYNEDLARQLGITGPLMDRYRELLYDRNSPAVDIAFEAAILIYPAYVGFGAGYRAEVRPSNPVDLFVEVNSNPGEFYFGILVGTGQGLADGAIGLASFLWTIATFDPMEIIRDEFQEILTNTKHRDLRMRQLQAVASAAVALERLRQEILENPQRALNMGGDFGIALGHALAEYENEEFMGMSTQEKGELVGWVIGAILFEIIMELIVMLVPPAIAARLPAAGAQASRVIRATPALRRAATALAEASPSIRRILDALHDLERAEDLVPPSTFVAEGLLDDIPARSLRDGAPPIQSAEDVNARVPPPRQTSDDGRGIASLIEEELRHIPEEQLDEASVPLPEGTLREAEDLSGLPPPVFRLQDVRLAGVEQMLRRYLHDYPRYLARVTAEISDGTRSRRALTVLEYVQFRWGMRSRQLGRSRGIRDLGRVGAIEQDAGRVLEHIVDTRLPGSSNDMSFPTSEGNFAPDHLPPGNAEVRLTPNGHRSRSGRGVRFSAQFVGDSKYLAGSVPSTPQTRGFVQLARHSDEKILVFYVRWRPEFPSPSAGGLVFDEMLGGYVLPPRGWNRHIVARGIRRLASSRKIKLRIVSDPAWL